MNTNRLFEPLDIAGKLTLPNRIVMAPMTTTSGNPDGSFSDEEIDYLTKRARAGVGTIISPASYCHPSGHAFALQVGCHDDAMLPGMTRLAENINKAGAVSFLQIHHGGNAARKAFIAHQPWAPSAVKNRSGTSELPREMTENEIWVIIQAFAEAADRAKRAGFSGVELHGANTYLLQQFFSPYTNRRTDRWGPGTFQNRTRFCLEVVKAVREAVGPDYPVAYRVSPEEADPDGYSTYETIDLLNLLVPAGVDIVHVSSWRYGEGVRNDYPADTHPTRMIREAIEPAVPVIGVGDVSHPDHALRMLDDGIDLVALGRILLLDADWAAKVKAGDTESIVTGISSEKELQQLAIPTNMKQYIRKWVLANPS
ncbi:MAG: tRNA-dihydrouridine synthase [candidate division Zixibacteria bacterium]|nr:tRNA-dihydrouridine synthase [candidate division Zixibacteria bacterium]